MITVWVSVVTRRVTYGTQTVIMNRQPPPANLVALDQDAKFTDAGYRIGSGSDDHPPRTSQQERCWGSLAR